MSSAILSSSLHCLTKATILSNKHVMFLTSSFKFLFILKREMGQKLLSHRERDGIVEEPPVHMYYAYLKPT